MTTMTKKDLIKDLAEKQNLTLKDAGSVVNTLFETITDVLKEHGTVDIADFGKFEAKERAARTGINPQTKEKVDIPATYVVKFSAKKALKDAVKGE